MTTYARPRRVVYDLNGKRHVMDHLAAHDMVTHLKWKYREENHSLDDPEELTDDAYQKDAQKPPTPLVPLVSPAPVIFTNTEEPTPGAMTGTLQSKTKDELIELASTKGLTLDKRLSREKIIDAIVKSGEEF